MSFRQPKSATDLLSIGELALATGLAPDTIRAWERRYGQPVPARLPSGHRRYDGRHVRWLRRVVEALSRGHRICDVVHASDADLDRLLQRRESPAGAFEPRRLLDLARDYRDAELFEALRAAWSQLGPREFLEQRVAPLLQGAGCAWADGHLHVRHEHFLTSTLDDLLRSLRLSLPAAADGPLVVLATLEGETHCIGLQLAALLCTASGARPCVLGGSAPLPEIAATVRETGARGAAIGVSPANGGVATDRAVAQLRRALPARVRLAVGGLGARGVRRGPRGIDYLDAVGFAGFERWLAKLA